MCLRVLLVSLLFCAKISFACELVPVISCMYSDSKQYNLLKEELDKLIKLQSELDDRVDQVINKKSITETYEDSAEIFGGCFNAHFERFILGSIRDTAKSFHQVICESQLKLLETREFDFDSREYRYAFGKTIPDSIRLLAKKVEKQHVRFLRLQRQQPSVFPPKCVRVNCSGETCGCKLYESGKWKVIANCQGHNWEYLLQNNNEILKCSVLHGRGGPSEKPCVVFEGNISKFSQCNQVSKDRL